MTPLVIQMTTSLRHLMARLMDNLMELKKRKRVVLCKKELTMIFN